MAYYDNSEVSVSGDTKIEIVAYPNPFSNETILLINSDNFEGNTSFAIFDLTGRDVTNLFSITKNNDAHAYKLVNNNALPGYYMIQLNNSNGKTLSCKLSITN